LDFVKIKNGGTQRNDRILGATNFYTNFQYLLVVISKY